MTLYKVAYGTQDLLEYDLFQTCVSDQDIGTSQPSNDILNTLKGFAFASAALMCCQCYFGAKRNEYETAAGCIACLWTLVSIAGSILFIMIFMYLSDVNDTDCSEISHFQNTYNWAVAGI